jgi:hypothetical protein
VRLTEPQARSAFNCACAAPELGVLPDEVGALVARTGMEKYSRIDGLSAGGKVRAFIRNLIGKADEQKIIDEVEIEDKSARAVARVEQKQAVAAGPRVAQLASSSAPRPAPAAPAAPPAAAAERASPRAASPRPSPRAASPRAASPRMASPLGGVTPRSARAASPREGAMGASPRKGNP